MGRARVLRQQLMLHPSSSFKWDRDKKMLSCIKVACMTNSSDFAVAFAVRETVNASRDRNDKKSGHAGLFQI
jgi:hypothetical protein